MSRRIELLIDCEEDRTLRAVLVGMLREGDENRREARMIRSLTRGLRRMSPTPGCLPDVLAGHEPRLPVIIAPSGRNIVLRTWLIVLRRWLIVPHNQRAELARLVIERREHPPIAR